MTPTEVTKAKQAQFGMIGLAVMGRNLALNVEEHGFPVAVWNLETEWVDSFIHENQGKQFTGAKSLEEFVRALERPRRIMMMIKAGPPVDMTIERIKPLLEEGDILIDGGNSYFKDTQRREAALRKDSLRFIGSGVSGGEDGARHGPSLMPGGAREAYEQIRPIFEAIAAKTDSGPCVTYVGPDGAGHFVKMVHNGIEYGDMQLIAEAYDILRSALRLDADELADIFDQWNRGPLESFLIEITANIFRYKDEETGKPLVDLVLDKAEQKDTGRWTAQEALVDLGIAIPTIAAAIDARFLSTMKEERVLASRKIKGPRVQRSRGDKKSLIKAVHDGLYASKICSYAQGLRVIRKGSDKYGWNVSLSEMARIWKGGCIIRARFLDSIMNAYNRRPDLPNLLLDDEFNRWIQSAQKNWRLAVKTAIGQGVPVPAMSASLAYFDSYRTARLPQNLTQAQRDYFGSHTYERVDHPERGHVHTDWAGLEKKK
ncbi:MAG TPA: decarboxylating NADP(+)-dependent phosphogluconate dehydrogenase [Blastocatellia bacterium]|nr:decarboxylating NADP(+)-dependent phosphogluconate dehydrogenase [Blastocatellia bacterium]